ncbi:IS21 family transposase [Thermoanaerobacterium thermosaccharolyticum]|uniref:IS21 family transposase n=1 Tax=Thermoanaerobacterium thermosaccharolyticum TaxID=1517 RepID=UPI003A3A2742
MELISLLNKQEIILSYIRDGKSQRQISRETGIDRKVIRKYIKKYEEKRRDLINEGKIDGNTDIQEIIDDIVEKPKYNVKNRHKIKLTEEVINRIKFYLRENEQKRYLGQSKQQKKKIDIYNALREEGYDIGYTSVCQTINEILNDQKEAYIKAEYQLGDVCEFDWGEVKLFIKGKLKTFQMAVFTSAKGNYRFAKLFPKQDTSCFQEAHAAFFENIKGVYHTVVYDNAKVMVKKFVGRSEKEPTEGLLKLSIYYCFKFRFCNTYRGNEKGHVERSVEFVRRKAFSNKDCFDSMEEANNYLYEVCKKLNNTKNHLKDNKSPAEILEEERPYLLPQLPPFDAARCEDLRVDKYSTIVIDSCHYSVPDAYVGKIIFTKIYSHKILCYHNNVKIAEHERIYGFNEWSIKIEHYLNTLKKKPGALPSSAALNQADPRLQQIYYTYYTTKEKEFIELLQYIGIVGIQKILDAIEKLRKIDPIDITTDKIKIICERKVDEYIENTKTNNEIEDKSKEMLLKFGSLMPKEAENFKEEAVI